MNWIKYVKLIIGTIAAILLAQAFHLEYAYAAGIITLLTIQETKQETFIIAGKRLAIFVVMTALSVLIFPYFGYSLLAFGIFLLPYLLICLLLDMKESIVPITVLATHYISSKSCSFPMIMNEFWILFIGAGIGVVLNLFFQNNIQLVKQKQELLDERMKAILKKMAFYITKDDKSEYNDNCFQSLDQMVADLRTESVRYIQNHFFKKDDYYYSYMQMRLGQCELLKRIYTDINRIDMVPEQAKPISDFLDTIANEFHEANNAIALKSKLKDLNIYYEQLPLPASRLEFTNRAILYHILKDLEALVELKREFAMKNGR